MALRLTAPAAAEAGDGCKLHMLAHVLWRSILKHKHKTVFVCSVVYVFTSIANC